MKNRYLPLAVMAVSAFLIAPAAAQMMGPPTPMSMSEYASVNSGQPIRIVVRVTSLKRTMLKARVLDRQSDSQYKATHSNVDLYYADETPIVMGSTHDIAAGAVIFVDGVSTGRGKADIKKIIVLTGYVKVKS